MNKQDSSCKTLGTPMRDGARTRLAAGHLSSFCQALAQTCREEPVAEKWVIAPSLRVGHQWLQNVARAGQPSLNCRVKTLKGVALELAGPEMVQKKVSLVSTTGSLILIDLIVRRLPAEAYLSRLPPSPGLARVFVSSVNALRMAGLAADDIQPACFDEPSKSIDLRFVLNAFMDELRTRGLIDYPEVLRMAESRIGSGGTKWPLVLIPEDADLTAMERSLLGRLPDRVLRRLPVDQPAMAGTDARKDETDASLLRWLAAPASAPAPLNDGTAGVFHANGEINEVREALRRCVAEGWSLDEVELLHTDKSVYVQLIFETLLRVQPDDHGQGQSVPATFAEGIPAVYSRPGRALMGWIQWIAEDYPQKILERMIQDRLLAIPGMREKGLSWHQLTSVLRSSRIGWGKDRYREKLEERIQRITEKGPHDDRDGVDQVEDGMERKAESSDETAAGQLPCLAVILDLVNGLLSITPEERAPQEKVLRSAYRFLEEHANAENETDNYGRKALMENIAEMARWIEQADWPVSLNMWEWLSALPASVSIMGSGPRPGHLHVAHLAAGGFSGRKHTIIIGLDESRFPGTVLNDPLLLDTERQKLSQDLPTSQDQINRNVKRFTGLLARLRGTVTLGCSSLDLSTDRELFPSNAVFSAFRILSGKRQGDQSDLMQWLSVPASFAPLQETHYLDETEWWLWRLCGRERVSDPVGLVEARFPRLRNGRQASNARRGPDFTIYDGRIPDVPEELDPTFHSGPVMSSAMLETMGTCPLRYFFKYVLEIRPREELRYDPTTWLDPIEFGNLLHDVFYRFMGEIIGQRRLPLFERDSGRLAAILEDQTRRYMRLYPPPGPSVLRQQRVQLSKAARIFLKEEEILCREHRPMFVEVSVGMAPRGRPGPMDTADPAEVSISDGKKIRVRGRIDRIDMVGDDHKALFAVCDYKTGSEHRYSRPDPFWAGRVIQHALYLKIAESLLKRKVYHQARLAHFEYYFPQSRGRGRRIRILPRDSAKGTHIVHNLCQLVASGSFLATIDDRQDCPKCDYLTVCRDPQATAASARLKLGNSQNTVLEPFRELRGTEVPDTAGGPNE